MFVVKTLIGAGLLGGMLLAGGCQSAGGKSAAKDAATTQAVACSKCQITYVRVPATGQRARMMGYSIQKRMECPDCRSAVANFFATGKLEHDCKQCGNGAIQTCENH